MSDPVFSQVVRNFLVQNFPKHKVFDFWFLPNLILKGLPECKGRLRPLREFFKT